MSEFATDRAPTSTVRMSKGEEWDAIFSYISGTDQGKGCKRSAVMPVASTTTKRGDFPAAVDPYLGGTLSYTEPLPASQRVFPHKSMRVGIIGAGPAGIHLAHLLKERGFEQVKILEKTSRVGGKSFTVNAKKNHLDGVESHSHEMGTCFLHQGYGRIFKLLRRFDPDNDIVVPVDRDIYVTNPSLTSSPKDPACCGTYLLPPIFSMIDVFQTIERYTKFHNNFFGRAYEEWPSTVPPELPEAKMREIDMPFKDFLEMHDFSTLLPLLQLGHTMQGYGILETIPAFYGLWWFTPALCSGLTTVDPRFGKRVLTMMLKKGYNSLWQRIYEKSKIDVDFDVTIKAIDRSGKHTPVVVEAEVQGQAQVYEFDFICVAAPVKHIVPAFAQLTSAERELAHALTSFTFTTTLYTARQHRVHRTGIAYWPEHLLADAKVGTVVADRFCKKAVADTGEDDPYQDRVAYQFNDRSLTKAERGALLPALKAHLDNTGSEEVRIKLQKVWDYFPHYGLRDVRKRYTYRRLARQGELSTWWIGSSNCFESVLDVTAYNELLVEHLIRK